MSMLDLLGGHNRPLPQAVLLMPLFAGLRADS